MNPKILREMTGSTHGIKYKIIPPRKPKKRKVRMPPAGGGLVAEAAGAPVTRHAARSLSFSCWLKTTRPLMDDGAPVSIGMRKVTSFPFRDSTLGWPTTTSPSGNGKKSVPGYRANVSLVTVKKRSAPARRQFAFTAFEPGKSCGSRRRKRAKNSGFAAPLDADTGSSSCKLAFPGMQIFSQTSQLASAASFIVESPIEAGGVISC